MHDPVNHPAHYTDGQIEVIDFIDDKQLSYCLGNAVKYISRVFKQRTGKNLTDFIGEIRIQKAKELLTQTDQKVGDIAAAVGIENRTTFLRVFKKYEGISPIEYRNLHQHDKTNGAEP